MNSARSRRLGGSLGDSWGDADYESDGGASIQTASELGSDVLSESDLEDLSDQDDKANGDVATPLPPRATRAFPKSPQDTPVKLPAKQPARTPVKTPTTRNTSRHSQHSHSHRTTPTSQPRLYQSTPGSNSREPAFIMPSMSSSKEGVHTGSPLRKSQLRARKARTSAEMELVPRDQDQPLRKPRDTRAREASPIRTPWYYLELCRQHFVWPVLRYVFNVGGLVMEYLKPVIALLVAVWVMVSLIKSGTRVVQTTLSPICHLPLSSYVLPFCSYYKDADYGTVDGPNFDSFMDVQSSLEDIMKENQDASTLPQTMKQSELAIRDLKTLVQYSKLPSRNMLGVEFDSFIATAKEASHNLITYNHKIGSTVDKIVSTNRWTIQILQGYADKESETGKLERAIANFNPARAFWAAPPSMQQKVFEQYVKHVSNNADEILKLIEMGVALLGVLTHMDNQLDTIGAIAIRDDVVVHQNHDELLSQLWSKLGGNKATRKEYERQIGLLRDVDKYKQQAIQLVSNTLMKLQAISVGLEDLRDTVAAPETIGFRAEIPIDHYIELVEKATDRLQDARGAARQAETLAYRSAMGNNVDGTQPALPGTKEEPPVVYAKVKGGTRK